MFTNSGAGSAEGAEKWPNHTSRPQGLKFCTDPSPPTFCTSEDVTCLVERCDVFQGKMLIYSEIICDLQVLILFSFSSTGDLMVRNAAKLIDGLHDGGLYKSPSPLTLSTTQLCDVSRAHFRAQLAKHLDSQFIPLICGNCGNNPPDPLADRKNLPSGDTSLTFGIQQVQICGPDRVVCIVRRGGLHKRNTTHGTSYRIRVGKIVPKALSTGVPNSNKINKKRIRWSM